MWLLLVLAGRNVILILYHTEFLPIHVARLYLYCMICVWCQPYWLLRRPRYALRQTKQLYWQPYAMQRNLFTRRRSFAEYWKHFVARFNDVYASGYNSARSERIWMKFGVPWVYCLELALTDFGRDPCRSERGTASGNVVFLSGK